MSHSVYTVTEFRQLFYELVNRVAYGEHPIVIRRHGKDVAVLISFRDFEILSRIKDEEYNPEMWRLEKLFYAGFQPDFRLPGEGD